MAPLLSVYPPEIKRNYYYDLAGAIFFGLFFGGLSPFILVQARRMGATALQISYLAALPCLWMLFSPVWAMLWRKGNPFKVILWCEGTGRLLLVLLLLNSSLSWYAGIFTFYYLLGAMGATVYGKAMKIAYPAEIRGTLMGRVRIGSSLAMMLGAGLGGLLIPSWGVRRFFATIGVFGFLSTLCFSRMQPLFPEAVAGDAAAGRKSYRAVWNDRSFCRFMKALFLFGLSNLMAMPVYILYQVDVLKITDGFISLLALTTNLSSLVFFFYAGRAIDRRSPVALLTGVIGCNLLAPVIYLFVRSPWPLLPVAVIHGILNAGADLASINSVLYFAGERETSPYMSVHITLLGVRGTIGPLVGPFFAQVIPVKLFFFGVLLMNLVAFRQMLRVEETVVEKHNDDDSRRKAGPGRKKLLTTGGKAGKVNMDPATGGGLSRR